MTASVTQHLTVWLSFSFRKMLKYHHKTLIFISVITFLLMTLSEFLHAKPKVTRVIGMLSKQKNTDCKLLKKENCKSHRFEVGFVRVIGSKISLNKFLDQPVIAYGVANYKIPEFEYQEFSGCDPNVQCRSDFAASSGKHFRKWRYNSLEAYHFSINKVEKYI